MTLELVERPEPAWPKPQKPSTSRGRLVRAWASKGNGEKDWVESFERLPGTPRVVVCDGAGAIARAASAVWGTAEGSVRSELVRCTWHMKKNLREHIETDLMRADRKPGTPAEKRARAQAHWLHELFGTALDSAGQWHDFREWAYVALGELWFGEQEVRASKTQPARMVPYDSATLNWLRTNERRVLLHIACRQLRPGPESSGPLEGAIVKLRTALASRAQSIGNRERTQLLLRLLAAGQRGQADQVQWAERVRAYVASVDGTPPPQRRLAQPLGTRTL